MPRSSDVSKGASDRYAATRDRVNAQSNRLKNTIAQKKAAPAAPPEYPGASDQGLSNSSASLSKSATELLNQTSAKTSAGTANEMNWRNKAAKIARRAVGATADTVAGQSNPDVDKIQGDTNIITATRDTLVKGHEFDAAKAADRIERTGNKLAGKMSPEMKGPMDRFMSFFSNFFNNIFGGTPKS